MDWTEEEKLKCWRAAESVATAGAKGECNVTFEQFKALISDEGGFDLPSRVKDSAASLAANKPDARPQAPEGHFFDADGALRREPSSTGQQSAEASGSGAAAAGGGGAGGGRPSAMPPKVRASLASGGGVLASGESDLERVSCASSVPESEDSKDGERRPALLARKNGSSPEASANGFSDHLRNARYRMHKEPTVPTALPSKSTPGELPDAAGASGARSKPASSAGNSPTHATVRFVAVMHSTVARGR